MATSAQCRMICYVNLLFLLYVASLSLWSIVVLLIRVNVDEMRTRFASTMPVRMFAVYVIVVSALFFVTGMRQIALPCLSPARLPFFKERMCSPARSMCWIWDLHSR